MKNRKFLVVAGAAAFLFACGGDDNGGGGTASIGDDGTSAVTTAVTTGVQAGVAATGVGMKSSTRAAVGGTIPEGLSAPCPAGGTVDISGSVSVDEAGESGITYHYSIDETFNDCAVIVGGTTYTLGGSITASGNGSVSISGEDPVTVDGDTDASIEGTVSVTGGDVAVDDCVLDYTQTVSIDMTITGGTDMSADYAITWDGSVCGTDVSGDWNYSYPS